jgi:hypothetical protein
LEINPTFLASIAVASIFPVVAEAASAQKDPCNPPQGIVAFCNTKAGGYCNPKTGYTTVQSHQIPAKNQCIWEQTYKVGR